MYELHTSMNKAIVGLTKKFSVGQTCERCTIPLLLSTYEDETIVYSNSKRKTRLYCLRCANRLKIKPTNEEINNFLIKQIGTITVFMKKVFV